jgi:hypothetical protein
MSGWGNLNLKVTELGYLQDLLDSEVTDQILDLDDGKYPLAELMKPEKGEKQQ